MGVWGVCVEIPAYNLCIHFWTTRFLKTHTHQHLHIQQHEHAHAHIMTRTAPAVLLDDNDEYFTVDNVPRLASDR